MSDHKCNSLKVVISETR